MDEILKKISSYNIFNYLLPGVLFALAIDRATDLPMVQEDLLLGLFLYYFVGLVISRIGSLIIEPILVRSGFVTFADYSDFVRASARDEMIGVLSESSNMFRTMCSLAVCIAATILYSKLSETYEIISRVGPAVFLLALFLLFLFSYRKQSAYIRKRVEVSRD